MPLLICHGEVSCNFLGFQLLRHSVSSPRVPARVSAGQTRGKPGFTTSVREGQRYKARPTALTSFCRVEVVTAAGFSPEAEGRSLALSSARDFFPGFANNESRAARRRLRLFLDASAFPIAQNQPGWAGAAGALCQFRQCADTDTPGSTIMRHLRIFRCNTLLHHVSVRRSFSPTAGALCSH